MAKTRNDKSSNVIICTVFNEDGVSIKIESENLGGRQLNKANFSLMIDQLKKESEKYPDVFE